MVTVLLPGAVQTDDEILEKGMSFVEDREADDVDPLVRYVVQLQQRELLQGREGGKQRLLISALARTLARPTRRTSTPHIELPSR